jgi:hypothetical protein
MTAPFLFLLLIEGGNEEIDGIRNLLLLLFRQVFDGVVDADEMLIDLHLTDIVIDVGLDLGAIIFMGFAAHEEIDGDIEDIREFNERLDIRFDTADFVFGDVVLLDVKLLGQISLGQASLSAEKTEILFQFHNMHSSLFKYYMGALLFVLEENSFSGKSFGHFQ